jgi:hypothetical protein
MLTWQPTSGQILFLRGFVKHNRKLPPHIYFKPTTERWLAMVQRSHQVISWMDREGDILLDCWYVAKYAMAYSALVQ